jgi:hypothetical protein
MDKSLQAIADSFQKLGEIRMLGIPDERTEQLSGILAIATQNLCSHLRTIKEKT